MSDATTEQPSYEEAREELIEVVRTLEAGGTTLEESLALWERGEALAKVCQQWLDGARKRLDDAMGRRAPTTDRIRSPSGGPPTVRTLGECWVTRRPRPRRAVRPPRAASLDPLAASHAAASCLRHRSTAASQRVSSPR